MNPSRRSIVQAGALIGLFGRTLVHAQPAYPDKPIRLIVPFPAGGAADAVARPLAAGLTKLLGQTMIVENKPGANSTLGVQYVARAPADGYTLLFGGDAGLSLAPNIQTNLGYDPTRDLASVAILASGNQVLLVNEKSPMRTVDDLARAAKAAPGAVSYASLGVGSLSHVSMEALTRLMGTTMNHVPYQGVAPAITDLIGGQVQVMLCALSAALPQIKASKVRALGFAGPARMPLLPEVPTIEEQGYPGFISRGWFGVMVPAATPQAVVAKLRPAISTVTQDPAFQQGVLQSNGYNDPRIAAADVAGFIAAERSRSKALIDPIRNQLK